MDDQDSARAAASSSTLDDECLGDFLYATEPPEDEDVLAISINVSPIVSISASRVHTSTSSSQKSTGEIRKLDHQNAVKAWLGDLIMETEGECFTSLQSKALPRRKFREIITEKSQTRDLKIITSSATAAATQLLIRADGFTRNLRQVVK